MANFERAEDLARGILTDIETHLSGLDFPENVHNGVSGVLDVMHDRRCVTARQYRALENWRAAIDKWLEHADEGY